MKEKRSFKRVDLFSLLAMFGVLLMFVVEGFFVFEFYESGWIQTASLNREPAEGVAPEPGAPAPTVSQPVPAEESVPVEREEVVPVG